MKNCIECGCLMSDNHIGDICEVCRDERGDTVSDRLRKEGRDRANTFSQCR